MNVVVVVSPFDRQILVFGSYFTTERSNCWFQTRATTFHVEGKKLLIIPNMPAQTHHGLQKRLAGAAGDQGQSDRSPTTLSVATKQARAEGLQQAGQCEAAAPVLGGLWLPPIGSLCHSERSICIIAKALLTRTARAPSRKDLGFQARSHQSGAWGAGPLLASPPPPPGHPEHSKHSNSNDGGKAVTCNGCRFEGSVMNLPGCCIMCVPVPQPEGPILSFGGTMLE